MNMVQAAHDPDRTWNLFRKWSIQHASKSRLYIKVIQTAHETSTDPDSTWNWSRRYLKLIQTTHEIINPENNVFWSRLYISIYTRSPEKHITCSIKHITLIQSAHERDPDIKRIEPDYTRIIADCIWMWF